MTERYFLLSHDAAGVSDIGWFDDLAIAKTSAHVMSLTDQESSYAVFDTWEQKIVFGFRKAPGNDNRRIGRIA